MTSLSNKDDVDHDAKCYPVVMGLAVNGTPLKNASSFNI